MTQPIAIDVWLWPPTAPPETLERWAGLLDPQERARAARFKFEADQQRFIVCRARLRRLLGWYTNTPPRAIIFQTGDRGKPALAGPNPRNIQFNLTHTGGLAGAAIASGPAVGFDLEAVREIKDAFIAHTLNPAEVAAIESSSNPALAAPDNTTAAATDRSSQRKIAFFRTWTLKEAYLKANGNGLFQSLKSFDVALPPAATVGTFQAATLSRIDDAAARRRQAQLFTFQASPTHYGGLAVIAPLDDAEFIIRTRWLAGRA